MRPSSTELSTIAYQSTGFLNTQSVTVAVTGESNKVTSFTYNSRGLMQTTTDPTSRTSTVYRDVMNRDSVHIGSQGDTSRWTYNGANRTVTFRDALANETKTKSNLLGWPIERTDPRTKVDRFAYDSLGNLITTVTRKGATISVAYDALGRILKQKWSGDSILFAYDTAGRWVTVKNSESVDTVYTDAEGRTTQAVTVRGTQRFTVTYGYSGDGSLYRRAVAAGGGSSPVTWGPDTLITGTDAAMPLDYLQEFGGKATAFTYDKQERVSQITLPTSTTPSARVKRQLTYGNGGRVTLDKYVNASALTRAYPSYDVLGRLMEIADSASPATKHRLFTYDARGRLASYADVERSTYWYCDTPEDELECEATGYWVNDETTVRSASYTYDRLGNRTDLGGLTATGNRLVRFDGDSMTYDDGGFLTRRWRISGGTDRRCYWNAIGQLDSVRVVGGALTSYGYDGMGRRVRKTVNGVITRYLLDGDHVVTELNSANQVTAQFTYYPGVDQLHTMRRGDSTYYYSYDVSGQLVALMGPSGSVSTASSQTPFGAVISDSGTEGNPFRFKGREWDSEAGLYYMRARYYDPALTRFISEDPIGLRGGSNSYTFAANDPVQFADPHGLDCELWGWYRVSTDRFGLVREQLLYTFQVGDCGESSRGGRTPPSWGVNPELAPVVVSECKSRALLRTMVADLLASGVSKRWLLYPNDYDFKYHDFGPDSTLNTYYQIDGVLIRSDEFGNFAAGFVGQQVMGKTGHAYMRGGGLLFSFRRDPGDSEIDWLDRGSSPMIDAGAASANRPISHPRNLLQGACK